MKLLIILIILIADLTAYTKAQIYELKNLRTTGRAAKEACEFYSQKFKKAEVKVNEYQVKVEQQQKELEALYVKSGCRYREKCKHDRKERCYKFARSIKKLSADIKKNENILSKYQKEYSTNKKFADNKEKEYKAILSEYLKKKEEWK